MPSLEQLYRLLIARDNLAASGALAHPQLHISHATENSRQVSNGGIFVAHAGLKADGHEFIPEALVAGAATVLGTEPLDRFLARCQWSGRSPVPYFQVKSSAQAIAQAAALVAGFPASRLLMAGITGTDGKTTSSALLASILRAPSRPAKGEVHSSSIKVGLISTLGISLGGPVMQTGYHVTTPDAGEVQQALGDMVAAGCKFAVVECTSHGLDQERVSETEMDVVGVTNVAHEHLDYHGSLEAYLGAKCRILDLLAEVPGRAAVANAEDLVSMNALEEKVTELNKERRHAVEVRSYGLGTKASWTYRGSNLKLGQEGLTLNLAGPDLDIADLHTSMWGRFNAQNILLAAAMAHSLGATASQIATGLATFGGLEGRMQRLELGQAFTALVDFAHSPQALQNALQTIRQHLELSTGTGRLIAIFGSAGLRDPGKRHKMGIISARLADHTVITAEDPRTESLGAICAEIAEGFTSAQTDATFEIEPDRARAMEKAVNLAQAGDVVVAFGKGHERSMCFGETEYPWSDQQALSWAIRGLQGYTMDPSVDIFKLPTR